MSLTLFGPGGVRAVVNSDLTPEVALDLGRAVGRTLGGTVALATDARDSARMVRSAMVAGMMAVGADVVDLGMIPTPALQFYVREHPGISGGVMVTASHNPPEYNGMKLILGDGMEATTEDEAELGTSYAMEARDADWDRVGRIRTEEGAISDYIDAIVSKVDADAIRSAGLTVCVDCACGAASFSTPLLLKRLGVSTVTIGCDPVASPHRDSDPTEENLTTLMGLVRSSGADMGIAHDGDGGRAVFIDGTGRFLNGSVSGAIVARSILAEGKGKVVTPISSSKVLEDVVTEAGGLVKYTEVLSHQVVRKMQENLAVFGVEEHGGMVFPQMQMCRDGGMALAKMLEIVAKNGPLADMVSQLPSYSTRKVKVPCPDGLKVPVMDRLHRDVEAAGSRMDVTDGIKVILNDGWALIRASTTEPCIRVYSESMDAGTADRILSEYSRMVKDLVRGLTDASRAQPEPR